MVKKYFAKRLGAPEAKLYLCSLNIDIGDILKVYDLQLIYLYEGQMIDPDGTRYTLKGEYGNRAPLKRACFKVIAEISSEATWVKEGDVFEENQILYTQAGDYSGDKTPPLIIQIKCWCCDRFK